MNAAPTGDLGYEDLAGIIIESVKGSSLGSAVADALTAAFTKRGVLPGCDRILEYGMGPLSGPKKLGGLWMSPGLGSANLDKAPYAPGVIQVHVALPERTVSLDVKLQASSSGGGLGMGGTPFAPKLLVRFDAPITFAYGPFAAADGTSEVQLGNSDRSYGATITDVPEGATDAYVMVANAGDQDGVYTSLAITPTTAPPSGEEPPPGGEPPVDIPKERISDPPSPSGCDCAAAGEPDGSAASGLAAVALALMGSWALRRARRLG